MDKTECKCGNASMTYEVIGEDEWSAKAVNTYIIKEGYGRFCMCKNCLHSYDNFDPCMVTEIEHLDN